MTPVIYQLSSQQESSVSNNNFSTCLYLLLMLMCTPLAFLGHQTVFYMEHQQPSKEKRARSDDKLSATTQVCQCANGLEVFIVLSGN